MFSFKKKGFWRDGFLFIGFLLCFPLKKQTCFGEFSPFFLRRDVFFAFCAGF